MTISISKTERAAMANQLCQLRNRCSNPNNYAYHLYGGRGIDFDPKLCTVDGILSHLGPRPSNKHTIDRIDNDLGYHFGNIRWATYKEQANNKRNNRLITFGGMTKNLSEWCEFFGISQETAFSRLAKGWSFGHTFTVPLLPPGRTKPAAKPLSDYCVNYFPAPVRPWIEKEAA